MRPPPGYRRRIGSRRQRVNVRQQRPHARIVRRDDERGAVREALRAQQIERRRRVRVVEIRGRLVGEHQCRAIDDRARYRDALRLPLRQFARIAPCEIGDADGLEEGPDAAAGRPARPPGIAQAAGCRPRRARRQDGAAAARGRRCARASGRARHRKGRRVRCRRRRPSPSSASSARRECAAASSCRCPTHLQAASARRHRRAMRRPGARSYRRTDARCR